MIAANIMTTEAMLPEHATLLDAVNIVNGYGAAAVLASDSTVLGVVTEDRLIERIAGPGADSSALGSVPVAEATDKGFAAVAPEADFKEVSRALESSAASSVVVVDDGGRFLGLITRKDMLRRVWEYTQKK